MNTNKLKRFAQEARKKLIEQVGAKLEYVLHTDTAELREKAVQVSGLKEQLSRTGKAQLIEKVAYTWFNRFMALRFMDVNGYQPLDIRVISPKEGYSFPELLDEAKQGHIPDALKVNAQQVFDLLDGKVPSANPQNEAYKVLLIAACNHLHAVLPFLFERINDYTELLLPDDLTSEFSIVHDVRKGMTAEDCRQVEIIGWLYQFYISEKKDEVFASNAKVKKEDIPAATQLFTPRWIVEYMVQNTVGKLWLQNKPNSRLREHMPYFIESASLKSEDYLKINSPEQLTLLDQACGSGHIVVYGFELLTKIYEEEGYSSSDIPRLIIENNLYGFEIDERAAQLAAMALMMKARSVQRRFFKKGEVPQPHILRFQDMKLDEEQLHSVFARTGVKPSGELLHDLKNLQQATNVGSLILPRTPLKEIEFALKQVQNTGHQADAFYQYQLAELKQSIAQLQLLARKYTCIVDNPPYMGGGSMNAPLADFVKRHYPASKADLMACFMESGLAMLQPKGYLGMINQHSWMFLGSYEKLRQKLIEGVFFDTLLHLGPRTFPEIGGEVVQNASFTFWNSLLDEKGKYIRLVNYDKSDLKREKTLEAIQNPYCGWFFSTNQKDFEKIPGSPIGYWMSENSIDLFTSLPPLKSVAYPRQGLATTNNDLFLRQWFEAPRCKIGFNLTKQEASKSNYKWFPINKGGSFRRWYGNNNFLVNFENEGKSICEYIDSTPGVKVKANGRIINRDKYFLEGLTWSTISSASFAMRYSPTGSIFETKGGMCFCDDKNLLVPILGYMNTKIVGHLLKAISPTLDFHEGPLGRLPIIINNASKNSSINFLVKESIDISKLDWDSRETSWDFTQNEFIRIKGQEDLELEEAYDFYQQYWKNKFFQLHRNEEELNRQFIEIYGLQEELTPEVPLEEITILQEETSIQNGELVFKVQEVMAQFVSYAVGCILGRYSLDKLGLILANQGETLQDYLQKIEKPAQDVSFLPDADNIIPILDDAWFEDDMMGRFYAFLKVTFGEANFAKNLAFVEESLGKDIRKYFVKDFYNDHIRRYKKRPIYWMFSSPQCSFNVLIYMHRYTPDTANNILNKYLREYQEKLRTRREHLERVEVSGSATEKAKATKEKERMDKVLLELQEYEREILYPLATDRIAIDLDDGVLVNYNKFGKAVKAVPGLNDAITKKKVREFDWIDTAQIR